MYVLQSGISKILNVCVEHKRGVTDVDQLYQAEYVRARVMFVVVEEEGECLL